MKKLLLAILLILSAGICSYAQVTPPAAQITAATTNATCVGGTPNGGAVDLTLSPTTGTVGISVTGTWAATLNIALTTDHGKTWTAQGGTFTANQQSTFGVAGNSDVCVFASAYTSGTAQVTFTQSAASAGSTAGTGAAANQVQGTTATGSATTGNPVLIGGQDIAGNVRPIACANLTSTPCVLQTTNAVAAADGSNNAAAAGLITTNGTATFLDNYPFLFNGATWDRPVKCPTVVPLTVGAAGTVQIVAPVAGQKVRVCAMVMIESVAGTMQLTEGTGATCATGSTNVTGAMTGVVGTQITFAMAGTSALQTNVSGDGLCIVNGAATVSAGFAQIEQH